MIGVLVRRRHHPQAGSDVLGDDGGVGDGNGVRVCVERIRRRLVVGRDDKDRVCGRRRSGSALLGLGLGLGIGLRVAFLAHLVAPRKLASAGARASVEPKSR